MVKKILLALVIFLVAFFVYAALKPDEFLVERTADINAPIEEVFAQINNLQKMAVWNPWLNQDPSILISYEDSVEGAGATLGWKGAGATGEGKLTVLESATPTFVRIKEEYLKPFQTQSDVEFLLQSDEVKTTVTWVIQGKLPFVPKVMSIFVGTDTLIGKEMEHGLTHLKAIAEE